MRLIGPIRMALCMCLCSGSALSAQVVRGTVIDGSTNAPIRGSFVALQRDGRQVTAVLTGAAGEFIFRLPAGTYSLRADRIGHQTATVPAFDVAAEQTRTFTLKLEVAALRLAELTVRTDARCSRIEGSRQTAAVWEEAKKALTIAAWVETNAPATFRVRHTERDLDLQLREVRAPQIRFGVAAGKRAFRTWDADSLERFGYVYTRNEDTFFAGPDAELLLSSSFLSQHCFRLERRADRRAMIGLAFEPIRGRTLPDIRGVLWLDEQSAELRFIEYGYTGNPVYSDERYAGGRIEFDQLSNGAWIVHRWFIRAPRLVRTDARAELTVAGTHETGGEILDAQMPGAATNVLVPRVSLTGFVFDSVRGRPLEGALIYLSGTPFQATSGVAGRFVLDSIPAGEYGIAFEHPFLDSLPVYPPARSLRVDPGMTALPLATPSMETLTAQVCPASETRRFNAAMRDDSTTNRGMIFGRVHATEGRSLDGVEVGAKWYRVVTVSSGGMTIKPYTFAVTLDAGGRYLLCAMPVDHPIEMDLNINRKLVSRNSVRLYPLRLLRRDFILPNR